VQAWLPVCLHVLRASLQLQQQLCGEAAGVGLHSPLPSVSSTQRGRRQLDQLAVVRVGEMAAAEAAAWQLALGPDTSRQQQDKGAQELVQQQVPKEQEAAQPQHEWRQQLALCATPLQGVAVAQLLVEGPLQASLPLDSPGPAFLVQPWLTQPCSSSGSGSSSAAATTATALALTPPYSSAAVAPASVGPTVQLSALHVQLVAAADGLSGAAAAAAGGGQQQPLHAAVPAAKRQKTSAAGSEKQQLLQQAGACTAAGLAAQLHNLGALNAALAALCGSGDAVVRLDDSCWRDGCAAVRLSGHLPLHVARCLRLLSDGAMLLAACGPA
jgi:hypothetical protein